MPLHGHGHGGGRLPGADHDKAAAIQLLGSRKMRRHAGCRLRAGHRGIEHAPQDIGRRTVGHAF